MAVLKVPLSTYKVTLARQFEAEGAKFYANIVCTATDGTVFLIYFARPDSLIPNNFYNTDTKRAATYLPYDLYPSYIDLLRNEKPVSISLNSDKPEWNMLYTGDELVGEM
jgi:hypothetical protein